MFNHQYSFDIEIPKEVISKDRHDIIFTQLLDNKVIIGLMGYGKSGKDTIAKHFIENYRFHRVAFADNIKIEMNRYLKKKIFEYLLDVSNIPNVKKKDIEDGVILEDGRTLTLEMIDFQTEDIPIKKRLRPFIIWYGEMLREINGEYYWINKAFEIDANGYDNVILSDVRRTKELDIFEDSNSFKKRSDISLVEAGHTEGFVHKTKLKTFSTYLFHVSQLDLNDSDLLTHECIRIAQERWLIDHTFYVDPRLPNLGKFRDKAINGQVLKVAAKFKINKPDKTIAWGRQGNLFK